MKTFSLNDTLFFKITESGYRILREKALEFHREYPNIDIRYSPSRWRGEWYKEQLHWVLETFGGISLVGHLLPITDLTFDEPIEEQGGTS